MVGGVLLATGCFGGDTDTKAESTPTASKAAPVPSRTPLCPTGSAGCENDLVDFRTERVATMHVSRPEAAHVCGPDGTPTADRDDLPSPTAEPDPYAPSTLPTEDLEDLPAPGLRIGRRTGGAGRAAVFRARPVRL
ncbi:hypothetical protein [Streptomyces europaeiscabiei]|uniref:hypothetical protein n=1 Tax=Streptomyces europaeiscabiei TaxID=146819 RepID=UPI0038F6C51D